MGFKQFLAENWFTLLQTTGIISGLLLNAAALRADARSRRASNLLNITSQQREIWTRFDDQPALARVVDPDADLEKAPLTDHEEFFVRAIVLHLNAAYHAMRDGMLLKPEGLRQDVDWFFSLPIPKAVWKRLKALQDADFARFVERGD